ncbi:MAG: hypothetical protein ACTSR2_10370 [Candidatus Hodarchaeales archaeon]
MTMKKLGRGYNAGYGELIILKMGLVEVEYALKPKMEESNDFIIEKQVVEKSLPEEFVEGLKAWQEYLKNNRA